MIIERVTYTKTFPIGPYLNEKIGIEIELQQIEPGIWETPQEALSKAKNIIEEWHKENNPHLDHSIKPLSRPDESLPVIDVERFDLTQNEADAILEKDKEILRAFEYKEDAAAYLSKSAFSKNVILNAIVNTKPSKA